MAGCDPSRRLSLISESATLYCKSSCDNAMQLHMRDRGPILGELGLHRSRHSLAAIRSARSAISAAFSASMSSGSRSGVIVTPGMESDQCRFRPAKRHAESTRRTLRRIRNAPLDDGRQPQLKRRPAS
jgi:hypothetical protein